MSTLLQQDWAGGLAGGPQKVDIGKNGISCKPPGCTLNVSGCGTYLKCLTQKYPSHQKIPHTELLEELFKPQTNFMMLASWSDQSLVRNWIQVSCALMSLAIWSQQWRCRCYQFYSWYSMWPPSPCPGSSQFIWLARAPPRKTLPTTDRVRLDRAAYDVCPMRAKENQTHSAALSGYDDSPRISVLPGSVEFFIWYYHLRWSEMFTWPFLDAMIPKRLPGCGRF